nr:unnamed protein product [Callosobruchus analis]
MIYRIMSPQQTGTDGLISALCTLVDFATNRCYKVRMYFNYVII